jgi:hypothetical protein
VSISTTITMATSEENDAVNNDMILVRPCCHHRAPSCHLTIWLLLQVPAFIVTFAETRKISFDIATCESKSEVIITWALEGKNGPKGSLSLTSSQDIEEYEVGICICI